MSTEHQNTILSSVYLTVSELSELGEPMKYQYVPLPHLTASQCYDEKLQSKLW